MHVFSLFFEALLRVALVGLLVGAGLPALFSVGIRAMAHGAGGAAELDGRRGNPVSRVVGYLCFALVLAAIGVGIAVVVGSGMGYKLSFEHLLPTLVRK